MQDKKTIAAIVLGLLAIVSVVWAAYTLYGPEKPAGGGIPQGTVCTMEAKQCPDGSYVGRQGPKCEFAPCPGGTAEIDPTLE